MQAPTEAQTTEAATDAADTAEAPATAEIESELLVEEISIDGMCGVY